VGRYIGDKEFAQEEERIPYCHFSIFSVCEPTCNILAVMVKTTSGDLQQTDMDNCILKLAFGRFGTSFSERT
jgi:hypothetical protein